MGNSGEKDEGVEYRRKAEGVAKAGRAARGKGLKKKEEGTR
jgi:hypothetical protein